MKRRDRVSIVIDILRAASIGASRTSIMYQANLNFCRFERYFGELVDEGLIEMVGLSETTRRPLYKTTKKAIALLEELQLVEVFLKRTPKNGTKMIVPKLASR